mmetsp:Transcript_154833/g.288671  ORF Transcript_154833/g.288671 Transcript_154833/m.288671 type:complete len:396 (-) Transcript_154833:85-1272(-)
MDSWSNPPGWTGQDVGYYDQDLHTARVTSAHQQTGPALHSEPAYSSLACYSGYSVTNYGQEFVQDVIAGTLPTSASLPGTASAASASESIGPPPMATASSAEAQLGRTSSQAAWQDLEEDLAECIAAWQESGHSQPLDFARLNVPPRSPQRSRSQLARESSRKAQEPFGPVLSVNVGGVVYRTTASTLRKARFFDSMLRYAEEGAMGTTVDDGGRFFVDRSGELFGYILEYMRSGNWLLREKASDPEFVDVLREEAGFYGLDALTDRLPVPRISEYVTVWQFRDDTSLYVDSHEQTIREDPDHQGLFRLCKYSGGLPLDQQTCTKRFKATSHSMQSVIAYFAMRGFRLQHVVEGSMITHTTSVDGQSRSGPGVQYILSRMTAFPSSLTPPNTQRS